MLLERRRRGSLLGHGRNANKIVVCSYVERRKRKDKLGYMAKAEWVEGAECGEHKRKNLDCFEQSVGHIWNLEPSLMGGPKQWENFREILNCPRESPNGC